MRMWMVDPSIMCKQHLLGEHLELHMLRTHLTKGKRVDGFVRNGLIDTSQIQSRHDQLVAEISNRGWNHKSDLEFIHDEPVGKVDLQVSLDELASRCTRCSQNIGSAG